MQKLLATNHSTGARLEIRVKPRSSRNALLGLHDGTLLVALTAPPVDGQANDDLVRSLAKWLKVPPRTVTLHSGAKSRIKLIDFANLTAEELTARLLALCPNSAPP